MPNDRTDRVSLASLPGTWRRRWVRWADGREDAATRVWWVQAARQYADLRLPPGRPSFEGVSSLLDCSDEQLKWLATQQGFAGELTESDDVFHWQRDIDVQPFSGRRDVGRLRFIDATRRTMIEEGAEEPYTEYWERPTGTAADVNGGVVMRLRSRNDARGCYVSAGNDFIVAIDRRPPLPRAESLGDLLEAAGGAEARRRLLDVEISYGGRAGSSAGGTIVASTFPWREGQQAFDRDFSPESAWEIVGA